VWGGMRPTDCHTMRNRKCVCGGEQVCVCGVHVWQSWVQIEHYHMLPCLKCCSDSLVPRLPQNTNMYHGESLVSFLPKHDIMEIGLKHKGNILCVQPTMHSTLGVYGIRPPIASKLPATFALFPVLSLRYTHT